MAVSWIMPNYSSGVSVAFETLAGDGYEAPNHGILYICIYPASERISQSIRVNGVDTALGFNGPNADADYVNATVLLNKGDIVTIYPGNTPRANGIKFFPCMGSSTL